MPRLPVDGKKVVEHRITLGSKERMLLQDAVTSYRIDAMTGNDSVFETLADADKVLAALATLGALLELFGITDLFDFDDGIRGKVLAILNRIRQNAEDKGAVSAAAMSTLDIISEILTLGRFETSTFGW
jgi:hypothetical protein